MACDFGIGTAANLASELVKLVASEASYSFKFKMYFEDFETEKEKLESKIESVVDCAKEAKKEAKKIDNEVEHWLNDADLLIARVVELEGKVERKNNISCFGRRFPNLIRRYQLAKLLDKMKQTILDLNNPQFPRFSHRDSIMGMKYYSSEGFEYFNSTKLAYKELLEALKDDNISRIGLYAMGGCGKTSLVKQVGKAAEEEKLFDKVVFAVVSRPVNFRQIQGNIAGSLDYKLDEEEVTERAKRLNQRLITGEKILIILDDVWEILNFEKIGIPFDNNQKKCRVLLTTRREDVCKSMDCKPIPLGLLTDEEALTLFRKHANITGDTSEVEKKNSLAVEITKECGGLPVAIKPLAITLKGKSLIQWEQALKALKEFTAVDIVPGEENPYKCLQLSYDMLEKSGAKSLFLFCSLFPEDSQISVESLIRFAFGLDMFQNVNSYKDARTEVGATIKELVYSSLLFEDKEQYVKMHDLVRDVALWLANKEKKIIISPEMDLQALAEKATTKDTKFLCCDSTSKFLDELDCPKLEMMMIHRDEGSLGVLNAILEGKKELKVLFRESYYKILWDIQSIHLLTNLRNLHLHCFNFEDMSFVGKLNTLTTLEFIDCKMIELPDKIAELKKLRLLDVSSCAIGGNPYQVLGKCSKLEELYFYKNEFSEREAVTENLAEVFQKNNSFPVPQRYWLDIGDTPYYRDNLASNILTICPFDVQMISNAAIKNLFQTAEEVYLEDIKGCKCIVPDILQADEGLKELVRLELDKSDEIECLFDNTKDHLQHVGTGFPKLAKLIIKSMRCMETLCRGPPPHGLFDELKLLELVDCPMLTYLFTPALAQNLVLLEEMEIKECHGLKHIVDEEEQEEIRNADDKLLFPKLKHLKVRECNQLEYLLHVSHARGLLQLKILHIEKVPKLKYVIGECYHEDQFRYQNQNQIEYQSIELPLLEKLTLSNLQSIITICPENYRVMRSSLQVFRVEDCPELSIMSINNCMIGSEMIQDSQGATIRKELAMMNPLQNWQNIKELTVSKCKIQGIFQLAGVSNGADGHPFTSCLTELYLTELPELRYTCKGPIQCMSFPYLVKLVISNCGKLKSVFSPCIGEGLPQLQELKIENCDQLEQIIEVDLEHQNCLSPPMKSNEVNDCSNNSLISYAPLEGYQQTRQNSGLFGKLKYVIGECCPCSKSNEVNDCSKNTLISSAPLEGYQQTRQNSGSFNLCNLKDLTIISCPMLISLFEPSTAKTLTSLEYMMIEECNRLKYIITDEGVQGHKSEEIVQNEHDLRFPRLKKLIVTKCDQLEYSLHVSYTRRLLQLEELSLSGSKRKGIFNIEELAMDGQQVTSKLRKLTLHYLPELRYILMGPKQIFSLQNVEVLKISGCGKLKCIFSVTVLKSLPRLRNLHIEDCEELEQIFEQDEENQNVSKPHNQQVCFPQLAMVFVKGCGNLKSLFSISTHYKFPKLKLLLVNGTSKLEQLFAGELGRTDKSVHGVLPELRYLILMKLPSLATIFSLGIQLQPVEYCIVQHCPKLALSSTTTLEKLLDDFLSFDEDINIGEYSRCDICVLIDKIVQSDEDFEIKGIYNDNPTPENVEYQDEEALKSEILSSRPQRIKEAMQQSVEEDHKPERAAGVTIATDSKTENPLTGPLLKTRESSPQSIIASDKEVPASKITMELASKDQQVLRETRSDMGVGAESIQESEKEIAQKCSTLEKPAMATSSTESELRRPPPKPLPNVDETQKPTVLEISTSDSEPKKSSPGSLVISIQEAFPPRIEEAMQQSVEEDHKPEIAAGLTISTDSKIENPLTGPLLKTRESSLQSIIASDKEVPTSKTTMSVKVTEKEIVQKCSISEQPAKETSTPSQETNSIKKKGEQSPKSEKAIHKEYPQELTSKDQQVIGEMISDMGVGAESIKESVEVGPTLEKAKIASSSIHSETRSSVQDPLVTSLHETSPKEFFVKEPKNQPNPVEQALEENKRTNQITQKDDKPSDLEHMKGPSNEKKTALQISSALQELKGSALTSVVNFPKRTSPLISSIPKMNAAGFPSSSSGLILQPELLQELKTELDAYLKMSLEAICESNAFDNVERIVNSLARGTPDVIQRNILQDFATRLKNFKECVPQAMNTKQSSFQSMSDYENQNMELNTKLSEGQGKVRDLESKFSETCEEEYDIEMKIQQLITRKIEILAQKNSLASQLDQSAQEVSKDYEKWKALGEELKLSTGQWLKSKEVLAHANASWSVFKESLRL